MYKLFQRLCGTSNDDMLFRLTNLLLQASQHSRVDFIANTEELLEAILQKNKEIRISFTYDQQDALTQASLSLLDSYFNG